MPNKYIPIIGNHSASPLPANPLFVNGNTQPTKRIDVFVGINPSEEIGDWCVEEGIWWFLLHNGIAAEMERLLGLEFGCFRLLHGKGSSKVGKFIFLDRRGKGHLVNRTLQGILRSNGPQSFNRTYSWRSSGRVINVGQVAHHAIIANNTAVSELELTRDTMLAMPATVLTRTS